MSKTMEVPQITEAEAVKNCRRAYSAYKLAEETYSQACQPCIALANAKKGINDSCTLYDENEKKVRVEFGKTISWKQSILKTLKAAIGAKFKKYFDSHESHKPKKDFEERILENPDKEIQKAYNEAKEVKDKKTVVKILD